MAELLVISGHDYRSRRKAGIHFITEAAAPFFARRSFFSIGFSPLSRIKNDPRWSLRSRANRWQEHDGVRCYLWRTLVHPVNVGGPLHGLAALAYRLYARLPSRALDSAAAKADVIMLESGLAPILLPRILRVAPSARLLYIASDLLDTIGVHDAVEAVLQDHLDHIALIRIPSRAMAPAFASAENRTHYLPHGLSSDQLDVPMKSPYGERRVICSVGSMLFDPTFFEIAADAFPQVDFHIIGAGQKLKKAANIVQHDEMPFRDTLPYIRFAAAAVAPYLHSAAADYLADTSLKLRQYAYYGIPAICPFFAVGDHVGRYGYDPGDASSIVAAVTAALAAPHHRSSNHGQDWTDVAKHLFR